jgi:hypothetical protein
MQNRALEPFRIIVAWHPQGPIHPSPCHYMSPDPPPRCHLVVGRSPKCSGTGRLGGCGGPLWVPGAGRIEICRGRAAVSRSRAPLHAASQQTYPERTLAVALSEPIQIKTPYRAAQAAPASDPLSGLVTPPGSDWRHQVLWEAGGYRQLCSEKYLVA